jgi:UPF0716 family protein affecting phage T7 exclusion
MADMQSPQVHMPVPSFWPIVMAAGILLLAAGVVSSMIVSAVGLVIFLISVGGWVWENREAELEARHE